MEKAIGVSYTSPAQEGLKTRKWLRKSRVKTLKNSSFRHSVATTRLDEGPKLAHRGETGADGNSIPCREKTEAWVSD